MENKPQIVVYKKQKEKKPLGKIWIVVAVLAVVLIGVFASGSGNEPTQQPSTPMVPQETTAPAQSEETPEPEPEPVALDPITYTGSGDDVIDISPFNQPWMLHISGNSAAAHFAVSGYDSNTEKVDLLVNTTEVYDGYVFDSTQTIRTLEISAEGDWTVEIVSLYTADVVGIGEPISSSGDRVLAVRYPDILWTLHVTGNAGANHFAVKGYDEAFQSTELFVNESEPYDGITLDPSQSTAYLVVKAENDWTIEIIEARDLVEANQGDTITGTGDMVIMTDTVGSTATIRGNSGANHFAVKSYSYTNSDLLVNTTDPYEGKVMLEFDPTLMVIIAEGDWSITFN